MNPEDEKVILEKIRCDDPSALTLLYDLLGQKLYVYLITILRSESAAEETLQDLFLTLARKRRVLLRSSNLTGYIFRMARNHSIDYRRRQRPADEPLADYDVVLSYQDTGEILARRVLPLACRCLGSWSPRISP